MDDDENWNLLAQSSPERLSGVPKAPHQDVPYITRAERQQVLPEQHVNMPFRLPVSPKHGPQEPKYHRSPANSAQPQEVLALAPCGSIARHGTCHKAEAPFCLKNPSHDSSVIVLSQASLLVMLALQHGTFRVLAQHACGPSQEDRLLTARTMKQRLKAGIAKFNGKGFSSIM